VVRGRAAWDAERMSDDDGIRTHLDLGVAYMEMGLLSDAVAELEIVLRHDPTHELARVTLAEVHAQMGKPPDPGPLDAA
jgi:Tfp pilus assembly protein PilF